MICGGIWTVELVLTSFYISISMEVWETEMVCFTAPLNECFPLTYGHSAGQDEDREDEEVSGDWD